MDFQKKFIEEASELVFGLESQLFAIESNPDDKIVIDEIFRVMHTLKGTASMFGFNSIEQLTHHLETIYDLIRDNELNITPEIIEVTFASIDIIKIILSKANVLNEDDQILLNDTLIKIHKISGTTDEKKEVSPEIRKKDNKQKGYYIFYQPDENVYFRGVKPFGVFYEISELGKYKVSLYDDRIPDLNDFDPDKCFLSWDIFLLSTQSLEEVKEVFLFFQDKEYAVVEINIKNLSQSNFPAVYKKITGKKIDIDETIKIFESLEKNEQQEIKKPVFIVQKDEQVEKESLLKDIEKKTTDLFKKTSTLRVSTDKLDDLITNVSEFVTLYSQIQLRSKTSENSELNKAIQALGKLSKKLRDNALELRLVPINELILKLQRLVRDLSKQLDKDINFVAEGTDTELDKTIIDNLEEPLMHIIRNSIDHGIENKDVRRKMNKPDKAIVRLTAFYSGANVFIQIQDDGKGIDPEIVRQKAIEKGLLDVSSQRSIKELYDILFQPGFSTAENVSKISGRGVGLDVVKTKINEMRGEIEIDSEINLGTSITVKLPLTLSIIDTLMVKIDNLLYLLPLAVVETCISVKYKGLMNNLKKQYEYENELLPVIILRDEFSKYENLPEDGRIVIIKQYEKKYCMLVDQVLGEHQAVVKPLGDLHKKHEYFSGVSVMGDGSLALILDTGKIMMMNKEVYNIMVP